MEIVKIFTIILISLAGLVFVSLAGLIGFFALMDKLGKGEDVEQSEQN
jgi:hypothetical protein